MNEIRKGIERGYADHGWLQSKHSFSFAEYFHPDHVEFGVLRVINEDRVQAGAGFGAHSHRDMEIVSYVLEGALEHKDSIGNMAIMRPGDVQRMSAGTGVTHSEQNASASLPVHFLQIWIQTANPGSPPSYEQKHFDDTEKRGRLRLVVSPDGAEGSVRIQQQARIYAGLFDEAERATLDLGEDRMAYVHVVRGSLTVNEVALVGGDAIKVRDAHRVTVRGGSKSEVLVFDLPKEKSGPRARRK